MIQTKGVKGVIHERGRVHETRPVVGIIDGNNFIMRAYFVKDENNSDIKKSLIMLLNLIRSLDLEAICVVFDGGRKWRTDYLAEYGPNWYSDNCNLGYKGTRTTTEQDRENIRNLIEEFTVILEDLGLPVVKRAGVEGDDVMRALSDVFDDFYKVIISEDSDMTQLINEDKCCYFPRKKQLLNHENFKKLNGYTPEEYVKLKAIEGDSSDNIQGIYKLSSGTLNKWYERSGEFPFNPFNWLAKYGTDKEYRKWCTETNYIHYIISLNLIDLYRYDGDELDCRELEAEVIDKTSKTTTDNIKKALKKAGMGCNMYLVSDIEWVFNKTRFAFRKSYG